MKRKIALTFAYLAVFFATWWCVTYLALANNLFDWSPAFNFYTAICTILPFLFFYLALKIAAVLDKRITVSILMLYTTIISFVVYSLFVGEMLSSGVLGREQLSPLWFKFLCGVLAVLPVIGSVISLLNAEKNRDSVD
ncbi:MAG: hypothetical protein JKY93_04710 [Gammaproteobacteria bacterium]|nr:hypothetical protein [Gammaproteobacteria bacterium]